MNTSTQPYNVYEENCPTRSVLARLADKWVLLTLRRLESGPARFNALRRDIGGVSQRMLTQTLRRLERDGLVIREVFSTVPVTVEYRLSPLGMTLTETITVLAGWVESNMPAILDAQEKYDSYEPAGQIHE